MLGREEQGHFKDKKVWGPGLLRQLSSSAERRTVDPHESVKQHIQKLFIMIK